MLPTSLFLNMFSAKPSLRYWCFLLPPDAKAILLTFAPLFLVMFFVAVLVLPFLAWKTCRICQYSFCPDEVLPDTLVRSSAWCFICASELVYLRSKIACCYSLRTCLQDTAFICFPAQNGASSISYFSHLVLKCSLYLSPNTNHATLYAWSAAVQQQLVDGIWSAPISCFLRCDMGTPHSSLF